MLLISRAIEYFRPAKMSQTAPSLLRSLATSFGVSPWARQGARLAPGPLAGRRYSSDEASETGSRQIAYTNRKLAAELAQTNEYLTHAKATALVNQTIELLIAALKRGEGSRCIVLRVHSGTMVDHLCISI